ncbi:MAG TPA: InlB B-repeat-containing protein, partial [Nocardioides sp.]|uniref:InlB B-repeat-containing protein n=1 Tax=Nocardioides sp. TaxID=35761 RepID=UPI002E31D95D
MNNLSERASQANHHLSSRRWRALLTSLIAGVLLLTGLGVLASPASATVILAGADAGPWPSAWTQYTYQDGTRISDLNGDQTPTGLDLASGTCAPAPCAGPESSVAYTSDGTDVFFRMRMAVDNNDASKGGLFQGAFLVQIANAAGAVKAVVGVNGKDAHNDMVYVADSVGGTVVPVYEFPFSSGSPSSAAMRWIPASDGTGQYFLDFQVPLSVLTTVSGGAVTATSKVKLYYGSSAAANLATINKDFMLGDVTSADFTDVKLIQFVPTAYTVAFDSNGGSAVASQTVNDGDPAVQPATPTRAEYVFDGWWTAATGGSPWSFTTPIVGATTLYAHWTRIWTVDFDSQGGSAVAPQDVVDGSPATAPADPTRSGHFLDGWFTAASGGSEWSFATAISSATTLYAHWTIGRTVSFDSDGGSAVGSQLVRDGDLATAPAEPTRAGHDFVGWFADGEAYDFGTAVTGELTLTAHWSKQVYTVSFDSDGGSAVADQPVAFGDAAVAPSDPTRAGHDFVGWFADGEAYDFGTPVTGALSLTAHWAAQVYTVSFDSDGGSAVADQAVAYGDAAVAPSDPTRTGHDFVGWFADGEAYDFGTPVTGELSLRAHWAVQVHTVSFDSDGGSPVADQAVAYGDEAAEPSAPTRTGYDFVGWFAGGEAYDFGTPVTGAMTLTAHWAKQVYTVSFDSDGGSAVASQSVAYQDLASEPTAPTRTGHDFVGWFAGDDAYDFGTPVTGELTLTAHWAAQVHTVSFDSDGGSAVADQAVAYGDAAVAPADPTRTGHDFVGWFAGDEAYDFGTPVTGAMTLTAHWAKQVYTVSFDSDGGSAVGDQSVAYQDLASEPTAPTRTGHDFVGWFAGGETYDFGTPVTGAMTLTAHWAKQVYTVSFDSSGGSSVASQSVAYQELAAQPSAPTRTGHDFVGWFAGG